MIDAASRPCTAFYGTELLASGHLIDVAMAVKAAQANSRRPIHSFDDETGELIDLDLRGDRADVLARLGGSAGGGGASDAVRGRGRPRLGVVAREVTLLPRHWEWLAAQPGGASVTLRRLVDAGRKAGEGQPRRRESREAAYRFLSAMAGDMPGFEEATRALFGGDRARFEAEIGSWPKDVRDYAGKLAATAWAKGDGPISRNIM